MGGRSYLEISDELLLFEANNTLPLFWLLGLTLENVQPIEAALQQLDALDIEDEEAYEALLVKAKIGEISVALTTYCQNLEKRRSYIEKVYPHLSGLYADFLKIILAEAAYDNEATITINYLEYLGFYEESLAFYQDLATSFVKFENNEKTIWLYEGDVLGSALGSDQYSNHHSQPLFSAESYQALNQQLSANPTENIAKKSSLSRFFAKLFNKKTNEKLNLY
ncbi:hypothetical protein M2139_002697 [Enterococcus sp. PF1-24]|uniref:hypothetical protein n=1 Tax=unclassified Enterococcus TaxID=2608891 RepID=UPI002475091F|nr:MULTISPECIES: hypothetical protein [unclassified Enterococcus]MDH6365683.1 hypothetical protein [Enterococcus sp. PFB1-1]MDH6402791.1 hypothetical protein [Enterococcus sp. PF1-24]